MTPVVQLIVGLAALLLGRRLFWLFVGAAGFIAGLSLAPRFVPDQSGVVVLLVALGLGVIGAVLAILLQRVAVLVAGFLGGGSLLVGLLPALGVELADGRWLAFLIGGALGAIFLALTFDWGLIVISALVGAWLVADALRALLALDGSLATLLALVLAVVGIVIQARSIRPRATSTPATPGAGG